MLRHSNLARVLAQRCHLNQTMYVSLQVEGEEQVGGTYRAPAPPQQEAAPEADEAAAGEGGPADEEESAQDTASSLTVC